MGRVTFPNNLEQASREFSGIGGRPRTPVPGIIHLSCATDETVFVFFKSVTKIKLNAANILVEGAPNAVAAKEPSARPREFLSHQVHRAAGALEKIIR